jgi:hypothetical protein
MVVNASPEEAAALARVGIEGNDHVQLELLDTLLNPLYGSPEEID